MNIMYDAAWEFCMTRPDLSQVLFDHFIKKGMKVEPLPETHEERVIVLRKCMAEMAKAEAN